MFVREVAIPAVQSNPDFWRLAMALSDFAVSANFADPGLVSGSQSKEQWERLRMLEFQM